MVNAKPARKPRAAKPIGYSPSGMCKGCHVDIHKQQSGSMHALSYENPVFQAQYYKEALPRAYGERRYRDEARSCAACHMPVAYATNAAPVIIGKHIDPRMSGVTCDLCHRISGYKGDAPGNGNYIASPGPEKYGPFRHHKPWHHVYLELQTKSEFCAICHNSTNQLGVEVKPTYTEWKASPHARNGIQCQDCHMNADGYLIDSEARYESGKAAVMVVGSAPERKKLYTHRFPGAKTQTHIENALPLRISTEKSRVAQGEALTITVQVSNERTGHRMPSGSIELRYLWLDLQARIGNRSIDIPASSVTAPLLYDVGGAMPGDQAALGEGFPSGKRVYRAIFLDENCKQTHSMIEAASKIFDNRLETAAVRTETFAWRVPDDIEGTVEIVARLHYVAYPESFATRLELPRAPTTLISASQHTVTVVPAR